jgi:hypothetical protein
MNDEWGMLESPSVTYSEEIDAMSLIHHSSFITHHSSLIIHHFPHD